MRIMISYSHRDMTYVLTLKRALEKYNFQILLDKHDIPLGAELESTLKNLILTSDFVLIAISPYSIHSAWVQWELDFALKLEKIDGRSRVLPVILHGNLIHQQLVNRKYANFSTVELMKKHFSELIEHLLNAIPKFEVFVPEQQRIKMNEINEDIFRRSTQKPIISPMVGTFYRSDSPGKPPLVKVGDMLEIGSKVCIIEAMKLYNEIETEIKGKVVKVLVEDSSPVEYEQPLFLVEM